MHLPIATTTGVIGTLLAFTLQACSMGINCRGSGKCVRYLLADVRVLVDRVPDDHVFDNGDHIACFNPGIWAFGKLCAFPQKTYGGIAGRQAKELLRHLQEHGCWGCGSVPVYYPHVNDVKTYGMLTVNYVFSWEGMGEKAQKEEGRLSDVV